MPFILLPATVEDAPDIASVYQAAFADDNIMSYFFPHVPASILLERDIKFYQTLIAEGMTYEERVTKVVDDDSGKIVAFSAWQYPYTEEQRRLKDVRDNERKNEEPEGTNHALTKEFFTQLFAGRKKWIKVGKTYCEL